MSEAILGLRRNTENETDAKDVLYNMMVEDGYNEATSEMSVDELIDLLDRSDINVDDVKQVACGRDHTFILKNDGSVWSCGRNDYGQLGLGDSGSSTNRNTITQVTTNINNDVKEIACGFYHTFILKNDGSVWSCGRNHYGQLGLNNTTDSNIFTKVTTNINNDVIQITGGIYHTIILKNDGSVWSCGRNDVGQLGLDDDDDRLTFTKVTTNINNDVKQIAGGYCSTVILKNDGSVWGCGYGVFGQLGLNDNANRYTFTQVTTNINNDVKQIASGYANTVILKNDGSVWACGNNGDGQLGLDDTTRRITFTQVTTNINNDVKEIVCGHQHTFIIKNDGSVWSCGYNNAGQLGLGTSDSNAHSTFTQVTTNINNDVKRIGCGQNHTFIIKNDGSVYSCGLNDRGQLGLNDTTDRTIFTNTNFSGLSEYDMDKLALYNYLLSNDIPVSENMDIGTMLDLLVVDYVNNMILGYENNLKIILTDEGVSVNNEDNMDSLIAKVDEEFNNQVVPAGDAVAANVLSGKTFINNTGKVVTGTAKVLNSRVSGSVTAPSFDPTTSDAFRTYTYNVDFGFTPSVLILKFSGFNCTNNNGTASSYYNCSGSNHTIVSLFHNSSSAPLSLTAEASGSVSKMSASMYLSNITSTGFKLNVKAYIKDWNDRWTFSMSAITYYAY